MRDKSIREVERIRLESDTRVRVCVCEHVTKYIHVCT